MDAAREKLIVALDVDNASRAFELQEALRDHVGTFKIGMQLFTLGGPDLVRQIVSRGSRVFLDLKFHDIPNTVAMAAIEATRLGVSMFNVHTSGGSEMMRRTAAAVADVCSREGLTAPTVLGVTLLTSADQETLRELGIEDGPPQVVRRLAALARSSGLNGVVASAHEIMIVRAEVADPNFIIVCPGIRRAQGLSHDQRRTLSAGEAVRAGADYVVIGRPVLEAANPGEAALAFQKEIGDALLTTAAGH